MPSFIGRTSITAPSTLVLPSCSQADRLPITRLAKVYIEPTSRCNLTCRTCLRTAWEESIGDMAADTFAHVLEAVRACDPTPSVFFGGFGEPLAHPSIVSMVAAARETGAEVEMITNGTMLTARRAKALIDAGLTRLWVSLDGATPASYTDVRLGAALPVVLRHLARFRDLAARSSSPPELCIAFVAMRRNLGDLPALLALAKELGAARFMVTNVLPHSEGMQREMLFSRALSNDSDLPLPEIPGLFLPRLDDDPAVAAVLKAAVAVGWRGTSGDARVTARRNWCPFIEAGSVAVGWDGGVSPCLPLLHTSPDYLHGYRRLNRRQVIAAVGARDLLDIWSDPAYVAFRQRVREFDFAPCTICDGCPISETNETDCYGSEFPACGGCLWAQGIVQCP